MSSKSGDPTACDGGEGDATGYSEGGTTMAMQKKRQRRVSFAEMTSIRFFDRDEEDNETPREESSKNPESDSERRNQSEEKIDLGFHELEFSKGEVEEERNDGDDDSDEDELVDMRRSFLRPIESPSPGSVFGSATSNDEDNFFGPVSASFIRPDRLLDSGVSDDNHDVTMDSTAFSMHFRSLARSDSGVDLKTPTGVHPSFEEKTPSNTNIGSSMELTIPKKLISKSSSPIVNGIGCNNSSDMSLVGGSPSRYDYGRLSPGLEALLAEGSKNLNVISDSNNYVASRSPKNLENKFFPQREIGSDLMDITNNRKEASSLLKNSGEVSGGFPISPVASAIRDFSSNTSNAVILVDETNSSPNQLSKEKTCQSCSDDKIGQAHRHIQHESPLADFISFSPAKQREVVGGSASPLKYVSVATPQEQRGSFLCKEYSKHLSSSSIQKSISKLNLLEASPLSSSLTAKAENLNSRPLDFPKSTPLNSLLEKEMNNFQIKHLDASSTRTGSQLLSASRLRGAQLSTSSTDNNHKNNSLARGHVLQTRESDAAAVSPSQLISSGERMKHDLFKWRDPNAKLLVTAGIDSSSAEITLDYIGQKKSTTTPQKFVPSPGKWSEKKLMVSSELQSQLSKDLVMHDQFVKLQSFSPGQNSASKDRAIGENLSTAPLDGVDTFSVARGVHSSLPVVAVNSSNLTEVNSTVDADVNLDKHSAFEMIEKLRTPTREKEAQFIYTRNLDGNLQAGIGLFRSTSKLPEGGPEPASSGSSVQSVSRNLKELMFQKNLMDSFAQSPSKKVFQVIGRENICIRDVEDVLSSSQTKSPPLKRRNEVFVLEDKEHRNEVAAEQRSPKLQKLGCQDMEMLGCPNEDCSETSKVAHALKHWTDIYSKFSEDADRSLAPSIDKLNLPVIDLLEDVLIQLKKSKTYGMLCKEIFAQETSVLNDLRSERLSLHHHFMHEKAKLQLMRAKQQRLLGKIQLLSSGIQECQMLKTDCLPKFMGDAQADVTGLQNFICKKSRGEVACDKVTALKQALEALHKKKANFIQALHTSCKIEREPSCADSIQLVNEHLKKRSCCRFIRLDMQMWVVDDVKSMNGHHDIVVNYLDFIIQRLKFTVCSPQSIVNSSKLDDINVMKNFPNMDACEAFSFVLNGENTRKYLGSRSLAQETQVTSSLLGNLLDVLWELQLAQIELRNLTETTFDCSIVGQLNLHLGFFSFRSGKKVSLMLDISCLNQGIYPSEIIPSQLMVFKGANTSLVDPIIGQIRDAGRSLRPGYMRILRLCRCISLVVQGSTK